MTASRVDLPHREQGFAMLVLLAVIGAGSVGLLLAVQAFVPTLRDRRATAEHNLQAAAGAARDAFRRDGAYPVGLDDLAASTNLSSTGRWRVDPFGAGEELDYQVLANGVQLRSRGLDGRLGKADDLPVDVLREPQLRARQRSRLRMLRAVLLRSAYRFDSGMSPAEQAQMRAAMTGAAIARRQWWTASANERVDLAAEIGSHEATIASLVAAWSLPSMPIAVLGAGGLMSQLGLPSARGFDGAGAPLLVDDVLGWRAVGTDGVGGTDDDM